MPARHSAAPLPTAREVGTKQWDYGCIACPEIWRLPGEAERDEGVRSMSSSRSERRRCRSRALGHRTSRESSPLGSLSRTEELDKPTKHGNGNADKVEQEGKKNGAGARHPELRK